MRRTFASWGLILGLSVSGYATRAEACGGCFAPTNSVQVVTDHRMLLSLSTTQTTLWDQFQYAGRPAEFSWILPIRYTERTRIQLASDAFITLVTNLTVPTITAPTPPPFPPGCQPPPFQGGTGAFDASTSRQDAPSSADSGVTVLREEAVGPYAVAVLRGTDAMVLRSWLNTNGYAVPAGLEPTIQYYVDLSMDFIALRLRPGEGINRMIPVRVTVEGYQPRLPLRMIAAGIADKVGLSLMVFNESRVEAMNFPNGEFRDEDFVYDWNRRPTNLSQVVLDRFDAINRANGGRAWITESAERITQENLVRLASNLPTTVFNDPADASTMPMTLVAPRDDARFAYEGIGADAVVTRLRADLEGRMLDRDLDLAASASGERSRAYRFGVEQNRPRYSACPWPMTDTDAGTPTLDAGGSGGSLDAGAPALDAGASAAPTPAAAGGGMQCAAGVPARSAQNAGIAVALAALAVLRRRRPR